MFVSSNSLKDSITYFKRKLKSIYEEAEIENIFFLVCQDIFNYSKIQVVNNDIRLSESDLLKIKSIVDRLVNNEPIQYIIGFTYFCDCLIHVTNATLIPRPETEELVEMIVMDGALKTSLSILDIGTGSGCISIALKKKMPFAEITAIDISNEALEIAKRNADENQTEISFLNIDVFSDKVNDLTLFDCMVSNPPYIPVADKKEMHKNVLTHEPSLALFVADENPLIYYQRIIELAKEKLKQGGYLYFEIHKDYGNQVANLVSSASFSTVEISKDLQGNDRFCKAVK